MHLRHAPEQNEFSMACEDIDMAGMKVSRNGDRDARS